MSKSTQLKDIISLAKRRGFIYQSSEIYGGLANVYDYGPLGTEMLRIMRNLWWEKFVTKRKDVVGMESQVFMHPQVWMASGHAKNFDDPMVEDLANNKRWRADHLIEEFSRTHLNEEIDSDLMTLDEMNDFISRNSVLSPDGNKLSLVRKFNLMFQTELGAVDGDNLKLYLRAETAQGMYVQFKNISDSMRIKVPFGIAQYGKAFRNEVTKGKFIFRTLEFEQMEIQYFIKPPKSDFEWEQSWDQWKELIESWYVDTLQLPKDSIRWKPHSKLIFYAKAASDLEYAFDWGYGELSGLHYRTDYDLNTHESHSGQNLKYRDPETEEQYLPHVMESTFGLNRNLLAVLYNSYTVDEDRVYLKLPSWLAPYQLAIFPLVKNKPELVAKAQDIYETLLQTGLRVAFDDRGNIGKRYYSQDEIGTPYCVTVDYQTLVDSTVTIRDRDTKEQKRIEISKISNYII